MLPQTALTWLLGPRYEVFYILPLLMFSLSVTLIIYSLRKILSTSQQVLLGAILFVAPQGIVPSNQLLSSPFAILFSITGVLLLIHQGKGRHWAVLLSAVLFFIAYGAHVTYLSLAVGGFLWLVIFQRSLYRIVIFGGTILLMLAIETQVFNYLSDWQLTMGRLELLADGKHIEKVLGRDDSVSFAQLLGRWLSLSLPEILLCLAFLLAGPWLIAQKKIGRHIPSFIECIYLVGLCYAVAVTFALVSVNPIRPAMAFHPMYLTPFITFAAIMTVFLWSDIGSQIRFRQYSIVEPVANLIVAMLLIVFLIYFMNARIGLNGFMWKANSEYNSFSERFRQGELILTGKTRKVLKMIALFDQPVITIKRESGISVVDPSPEALCVKRLKKNPLQLNYESCVN